jgi:hypothetical protein
LIGITEDKAIHLFVFRDLQLSNECARIQLAIRPRSVELVSMTDVCLHDIDPPHFQQIIKGPFKARKYTFNRMINVHTGSFCDQLLLSDAFLHAQSVEIHISYFLPGTIIQTTMISEEAVLHWFFNEVPGSEEPRVFVLNSVQLSSQFLNQLIEVCLILMLILKQSKNNAFLDIQKGNNCKACFISRLWKSEPV